MIAPEDIDLDHVALAVERQGVTWARYAGDLGGTWVAGGFTVGFRSAQVRFRHGMKVEIIAPHLVEQNDFLRRFIDQRGPGPHHLTFKVADIRAALAGAEAAGYPAVNVSLADPQWQEGFLHPKIAHGVVIQLAQSTGDWTGPPPDGFPRPRPDRPADLQRVVHAVASLDEARALYAGVLGGTVDDDGDGWIDLVWRGSGRVRLVEARTDELRAWLAGEIGRVHHLAFATSDLAEVPGAEPLPDGSFEVSPEHNLGTRLSLTEG